MTRSRVKNDFSVGIDDGADANAITIDSSERVGIGTTQPESSLQVSGEIDDTPSSQGVHLGMTANYANIQLASASDTGGFIDFTSADGTNYDGRIIYRHSSNQIEFATNSVSTPKVTILSSGGITFNGDTAAANALDDYEEGTWTPNLSYGGGSAGQVMASAYGTYTKIGRVVHCNFIVSQTTKGTSTGLVDVSLPFTVVDLLNHTVLEANAAIGYISGVSTNPTSMGATANQGNGVRFYERGGASNQLNFQVSDTSIDNAFQCRVSVTYFTA